MSAETLTVSRLGSGGDGIADAPGGPVYVPFSLPGETVAVARVKNHGTILSIAKTSPERVEPPCAHFGPDGRNGACGGCTLQHAGDGLYHAFKRGLVIGALKAKGLSPEVAPLVTARPGERRRVVLAARRTEKGILLGFSQAGSHHIVSIDHCPISSPGIVSKLDTIRGLAAALATGADPFRIAVLETLAGLDIAFEGVRKVGDRERRALTQAVLAARGIARVSSDGEVLISPGRPEIDFGGVLVSPPPAGFVQATKPAEEAMAALVLDALGKARRVADLFAGAGTFSLRIARKARVHAIEGDEKALKALDHAARNTQGLKPVTAERRDLFRRPLTAAELKVFDAVVFDPPRAGAEDQCREIARSGVKTVVAVSCNPLTLARDLSILTAAGYRIRLVTPIDQFLWSAHVEAVAVLEK